MKDINGGIYMDVDDDWVWNCVEVEVATGLTFREIKRKNFSRSRRRLSFRAGSHYYQLKSKNKKR